jgi:hypothetical protein
MPHSIEEELAQILMGKKVSLRETASSIIDVYRRYFHGRNQGRLGRRLVGFTLGSVEFGSSLRVLEYLGPEQLVVRCRGVVVELGPLRMELQGRLKELQSIVYLGRQITLAMPSREQSKTHLDLSGSVDFFIETLLWL